MASSSETIPATQRGQSGQLTYQFRAVNSRIPNTRRLPQLSLSSENVIPPGVSVTTRKGEDRAQGQGRSFGRCGGRGVLLRRGSRGRLPAQHFVPVFALG